MRTEHATVALTLYATTPRDPITALAKMDFVAMGKLAKVNIATSDVF